MGSYISLPIESPYVYPPVATSGDLPSGDPAGTQRVVIADSSVWISDGNDYNESSVAEAIHSINAMSGPDITIEGTADQIDVDNASDTVTLSLPQDIAATSSPTFADLELTGMATISDLTVGNTVTFENIGSGAGTALIRTVGGEVLELTSSEEFKENIRPIEQRIDCVKLVSNLLPVAYNYKGQDDKEDITFGFLAEDVANVEKDLVIYKDGKPYSVNYMEFVPVIVRYLQTQDKDLNYKLDKFTAFSQAVNRRVDSLSTNVKSNFDLLSDEWKKLRKDVTEIQMSESDECEMLERYKNFFINFKKSTAIILAITMFINLVEATIILWFWLRR